MTDGWSMDLMLGMMYVVLPMFWMCMLSWIDVNLGSAIQAGLKKGNRCAIGEFINHKRYPGATLSIGRLFIFRLMNALTDSVSPS